MAEKNFTGYREVDSNLITSMLIQASNIGFQGRTKTVGTDCMENECRLKLMKMSGKNTGGTFEVCQIE